MTASSLSTQELLGLVIRGSNSQEIAEECLRYCNGNLNSLRDRIKDIDVKGLGKSRKSSIVAAIEIGRRLLRQEADKVTQINQPADAARLMMPVCGDVDQEELWVLALDTKNRVVDKKMLYRGTVNTSAVSSREIFKYALSLKAVSNIILVHNHPSGDLKPSQKDITSTREIERAGALLSINLLDHVIVGKGSFVSFSEKEIL